MIIDSKKFNGMCSCGKEHGMTTEFCIIEQGCLKNAEKYIGKYIENGFSVAIYDENTYKATEGRHPKADREIILPPDNLHADNHGVGLALKFLPEKFDYLIAVGSGTVHDITRFIAYEKKVPFVSCPTAGSVDGFCSSVAAMTWDGFKKTLEAVSPKIVIADLDIITKAPVRLTNSGFGDMVGKYIALADWKIAHALTGEYLCDKIYKITQDAVKAVMESAEGIKKGDKKAIEKLTYGLLMSGLAMQMLGTSRCASGAEHHISHLIEMEPSGLSAKSDALHGEKVGVGTLIVAKEYHRIKNSKEIWGDYKEAESNYISKFFGTRIEDAIIMENVNDCCSGIRAKKIEEKWNEICKIISEIPTEETFYSIYKALNVKFSLCDIGVREELCEKILEYSPLVRNRLTLMRLRRMIKK